VTDETGLRAWMTARATRWRQLPATSTKLRHDRRSTAEQAFAAVASYRDLARDLSVARRVLPARGLTRALEEQYAVLHGLIHRRPGDWKNRVRTLFGRTIPAVARELSGYIVAVSLLFLLSALAGAWLVSRYPELILLVAGEDLVATVESGRLWTDNLFSIAPPAMLSISILTNNIVVSLFAFVSGILFGLGTFYIIALNGFMLGAIFAFTHQHGLAAGLFRFVIAHGVVELSVICIAGAAGAAAGESLIRPQLGTRRESFSHAISRISPLLALCTVLLIGCGFIEGYVSPDPAFPLANRVVIGVAYGVLMVAALTGRLYPASWRQ